MTIERIVNAETGEVVEKAYSKEQLKEAKDNAALIVKELEAAEIVKAQKQAIYDKLGLTADEIKILFG